MIMAVLNPEHLLQQAAKLIERPAAGPPRQVNIRRAISAAYYAAFHTIVNSAADQFVGITLQSSIEYALVARSIDHAAIRRLCEDVVRTPLPQKYAAYLPGSLDIGILSFAAVFPELQQQRHSADYDPLPRFVTKDATITIAAARSAISRFDMAPAAQRKAFLFLLLFPPKR